MHRCGSALPMPRLVLGISFYGSTSSDSNYLISHVILLSTLLNHQRYHFHAQTRDFKEYFEAKQNLSPESPLSPPLVCTNHAYSVGVSQNKQTTTFQSDRFAAAGMCLQLLVGMINLLHERVVGVAELSSQNLARPAACGGGPQPEPGAYSPGVFCTNMKTFNFTLMKEPAPEASSANYNSGPEGARFQI
ncbi:hypothetical protein SODALDRAFT_379417 [Sodiomyces alkalinus F11]|uniref:Uncharacterized protein n=1 Tax=Sodiomyces alkalinus (strain CBS 110278 / VKM F-3762 / F11) TaxID=1314773 RepID=A0A3N2PV47_SODAK|nr:hypothetical protein SODALDRAFT_379417 [Sodiomyces alkalinus F11]ROT38216.1 hypothetical protein SODALDRAFT_379417 [Sodiomyces alkalinus F11]